MKKYLLIILIIASNIYYGQFSTTTVTLNFGSQGYVTINGQNFKRGDLQSKYYYNLHDSELTIIFANTRTALIPLTIDSAYVYGDSSNKKAYNMSFKKHG